MEETVKLNAFERTIKAYLDNRAETDELFRSRYEREDKNIQDCCKHIIAKAQEDGAQGYPDEVVYGWAVDYYDEENVEIKNIQCKVVVNHEVQLTEEEKAEMKAKALEEFKEQNIRELKARAQHTMSTPRNSSSKANDDQLSIF